LAIALVLHAHLPFVRHPESDYVEEELYKRLPKHIFPYCESSKQDGIDFKITMSMTPPLCQCCATLLQERYDDHLAKLQERVEYEHNVHNGHILTSYATEFKRTRPLGTL